MRLREMHDQKREGLSRARRGVSEYLILPRSLFDQRSLQVVAQQF